MLFYFCRLFSLSLTCFNVLAIHVQFLHKIARPPRYILSLRLERRLRTALVQHRRKAEGTDLGIPATIFQTGHPPPPQPPSPSTETYHHQRIRSHARGIVHLHWLDSRMLCFGSLLTRGSSRSLRSFSNRMPIANCLHFDRPF